GPRRPVPQPERGGVGPGGAPEHGRPGPHVAAAHAGPAPSAPVRLHRPARARLAGRGLPDRPCRGAGADHLHGPRHELLGLSVPAQGAGRPMRSLRGRTTRELAGLLAVGAALGLAMSGCGSSTLDPVAKAAETSTAATGFRMN